MNAREDFNQAIRLMPMRYQKTILTALAPHFNPEMLAMSIDYLQRFETKVLTPNDISELIFKLVSDITGVMDFRDSTTRKIEFAFSRQLAMFALYNEVPQFSYQYVANLFGNKFDHATVVHACKSMEARYSSDKSSRQTIDALANLMAEQSLFTFKNKLESITRLTWESDWNIWALTNYAPIVGAYCLVKLSGQPLMPLIASYTRELAMKIIYLE